MKRKNNQNKIILVTGCGGVIGVHLCFKLLEMIFKVIEENKSKYKILLDNFKVTISKEDYLFKPV